MNRHGLHFDCPAGHSFVVVAFLVASFFLAAVFALVFRLQAKASWENAAKLNMSARLFYPWRNASVLLLVIQSRWQSSNNSIAWRPNLDQACEVLEGGEFFFFPFVFVIVLTTGWGGGLG